ncbi:MAG: hypothetical protein AABW52_01575 [Nanoarchaeota archaeon]
MQDGENDSSQFDFDINDTINREESELRAKAKTKGELTVTVEARIKSVTAHHEHNDFTLVSERIAGVRSPSYSTGTVTYLEIVLEREQNPKVVIFYGNAPVEANGYDCIYRFSIVRAEEAEISNYMRPGIQPERVLLERQEFLEKEKAFQIEKLKRDEVVRTDISDIFI